MTGHVTVLLTQASHPCSPCLPVLLPSQVEITNTEEPIEVTFTYSVHWRKDDTPFSERMEKLAGGGLLPGSFEVGGVR